MFCQLSKIQRYRGATPSPFDCFLVQRSLATLELRMERHQSSGLALARTLGTAQKKIVLGILRGQSNRSGGPEEKINVG